jgi:hypothetical protein
MNYKFWIKKSKRSIFPAIKFIPTEFFIIHSVGFMTRPVGFMTHPAATLSISVNA